MDFRHYSLSFRHDEEAGFELYDSANDRYIFAQWSRANGAYDCDTIEFDYVGDLSDEPSPILDGALLSDGDLGGCELRAIYGGAKAVSEARFKFREAF